MISFEAQPELVSGSGTPISVDAMELRLPLAALVMNLVCARPVHAYVPNVTQTGALVRWLEAEVGVGVATDVPAEIGFDVALKAVRAGIAAWTELDCGRPRVSALGDATATIDPDDLRWREDLDRRAIVAPVAPLLAWSGTSALAAFVGTATAVKEANLDRAERLIPELAGSAEPSGGTVAP